MTDQTWIIVLSIATLLLLVCVITVVVLVILILRSARRISQKTEEAIDNINDVAKRLSKHLAPGVISGLIASGLKRWRSHDNYKEANDE